MVKGINTVPLGSYFQFADDSRTRGISSSIHFFEFEVDEGTQHMWHTIAFFCCKSYKSLKQFATASSRRQYCKLF